MVGHVGVRRHLYRKTLQIISTNSKNNKHCKWVWYGLWGRLSLDKSQTNTTNNPSLRPKVYIRECFTPPHNR